MTLGKLQQQARWWWYTAIVLLPLAWFPYAYFPYEQPQLLVLRLAVGIGLIFAVWQVKRHRGYTTPQIPNWVRVVTISFFVAAALSTVFSWSPYVAWWGSHYRFQGVSTLLTFWLLGVGIYTAFTRATAYKLLIAVSVAGTAAAMYAVGQRLGLDPWANPLRIHGTFGHPNYLAAFLSLTILANVTVLFLRRSYIAWAIPMLAVQWVALWFTFTRTGWGAALLGTGLIMVILGGYAFSHQRIRYWLVTTVSIALVIIGSFLLANVLTDQFKPTQSPATKSETKSAATSSALEKRVKSTSEPLEGSGAIRWYIWKDVADILKDRWLMGVGSDALQIRYPHYYRNEPERPTIAKSTYADRAHNDVLDTWLAYGLWGLLAKYCLFGWLISIMLRYVWRHRLTTPTQETFNHYAVVVASCSILVSYVAFNQLSFPVVGSTAVLVVTLVGALLIIVPQRAHHIRTELPAYVTWLLTIGCVLLTIRYAVQPAVASVLAYSYNDLTVTSDVVVERLERAIVLDPSFGHYSFLLANVYVGAAEYEAAVELAEVAHEQGIIDLEYYDFMVKLYDQWGGVHRVAKRSFEAQIHNEAAFFGD